MGHLGNRGTAKQHHRAFEQRRRCGLLGCRYSPALPALLSDATPNRGLRVLCVFIVLIASSDAALAAGSMDEDDGDHDDHDTGDSEQDEQQQQAQKPRKRPCALPTGQLNDRTEPNRQADQPTDGTELEPKTKTQPEPTTTTNNRPVNRQTAIIQPCIQPTNLPLELGLLSSHSKSGQGPDPRFKIQKSRRRRWISSQRDWN